MCPSGNFLLRNERSQILASVLIRIGLLNGSHDSAVILFTFIYLFIRQYTLRKWNTNHAACTLPTVIPDRNS